MRVTHPFDSCRSCIISANASDLIELPEFLIFRSSNPVGQAVAVARSSRARETMRAGLWTRYADIFNMLKRKAITMDMNDYLSTRSNADLPFKRSRRVYYKISNWCIAISAGTLLWSIGNFDKFIITASDDVTEYLPYRSIYILSLGFFFVSTAIFAFLRGYVYVHDYYDMRLRDITDIEERHYSRKSDDYRPPLSKPETKFFDAIYKEYRIGYEKECLNKEKWGQTDWTSNLREVSILRAVNDFGGSSLHIWKSRINFCLGVGIICYVLGMIISFGYVIHFIWYYL